MRREVDSRVKDEAEAALELEILAMHDAGDSWRLAELYDTASDIKRLAGDTQAAGFLLTQAFVFALESGHPQAADFRSRLAADGRETVE